MNSKVKSVEGNKVSLVYTLDGPEAGSVDVAKYKFRVPAGIWFGLGLILGHWVF